MKEAGPSPAGASGDRPLRILLLAETCNPEWASLPAVSYNTTRALSNYAEVTLVTLEFNRPNLQKTGAGKATIVYVNNEYVSKPLWRFSTFVRGNADHALTAAAAMQWPAQVAFEWEAWKRFKDDINGGAFDIVQRLTPMSPTLPSPMARWCPAPFVVGPINGGLPWPPAFRHEMRREREYLHYIRDAYRLMPFYRSTFSRPRCILAGFSHTIADLPRSALARTIDFPEVGVDPEMFSWPGERPEREQLTFLYAGRLVPYKCPDVALEAFAGSPELRKHKLIVVGDGPERQRLEAFVTANGLEGVVEMRGKVPQKEVGRLMREADAFVFPSVRELGAGVVVEAMVCGCVPVVVNYGAPGGLVTEETGRRVPLGTKAELVQSIRGELEKLCHDRPSIRRMSHAAHERALGRYAWDFKARKLIDVYDWVLGRRSKPPIYDTDARTPPASASREGRESSIRAA
jgi:glycosyltransferase involved in cell wall biosynthesis